MGMFGGGGAAGGWSSSLTSGMRPRHDDRRGTDGWNDDELGKVYDHKVVDAHRQYVKPYQWRLIALDPRRDRFALTSYAQPLLIGMAIDAVNPTTGHGRAPLHGWTPLARSWPCSRC